MPGASKNLDFGFNLNTSLGVIIFILIIVVAVYINKANLGLGGATPAPSISAGPSKYDDFAKCLAEKGAKMYGTFWCSHCKAQKELFGSAFQYVNYQECTVNGDRYSNAQACKDANIKGYPTWKFLDGTVAEGELTLSQLAQKTGCTLP